MVIRLSGSSLDWLYESDSESVALLNWLSNKLTPDSYLNEDQLNTYDQIAVNERLSGGKVLEDALESLQDQDSSFTNEDLEKEISRLEAELGYYDNSCQTLTALNTQLNFSESRSSLLLNQLQEIIKNIFFEVFGQTFLRKNLRKKQKKYSDT